MTPRFESFTAEVPKVSEVLRVTGVSEEHICVELFDVDNCIFPHDKKQLYLAEEKGHIEPDKFEIHENFFAFLKPFEYNQRDQYPTRENKSVYAQFLVDFGKLRNALLTHHKKMLNGMIKRIKEKKFNKVILAITSARQGFIGFTRDNRWAALFILPIFQKQLQKNIPNCQFVMDPILMADLYSNEQNAGSKLAGESYLAILQQMIKGEQLNHANQLLDHAKFTQVVMHAHRACELNPKAKKVEIHFWDDNSVVRNSLTEIISKNSFFLPKNCTVNVITYEFAEPHYSISTELRGTGNVLAGYDWALRQLCFDVNRVSSDDIPEIKNPDDLSRQHTSNWLVLNASRISLNANIFLKNPDVIRKCYDRHIAEFSEMKNTLGAGGYMTVEQLMVKGLIPNFLSRKKLFSAIAEEKAQSKKNSNLLALPAMPSIPLALQTPSSFLLSQQSIFKKETTDGPRSEPSSQESASHTNASFKQIG